MTPFHGVCRGGLVAAALVASGCSYAFVTPSHRTAVRAPDCTAGRIAPVGDTAAAIASSGLIALGGAAIAGSDRGISATGLGIYFGLTGLATTLFTISAVHGFHTTARCRDDQAAWEHEQVAAAPRAADAQAAATVISSNATRWDVLVDGQAVCATPCSVPPGPAKALSVRSQTSVPVSLSVGRLPGGPQVLTAHAADHGVHTAAVATTVVSSVGIATGLGLVIGAVVWDPPPATEQSSKAGSLKSAGYGVTFAGVAGLVLSAYLFESASASVQVTPATIGTGATVGYTGAF